MRHIDRGEPPMEFQQFVEKESPEKWDTFVRGKHELYKRCRNILSEEQGNLSGYTEMPLKRNVHIDHFKKRSLFQASEFDWRNFVVDEKSKPYGADAKDRKICRHEENEKLVNPVEENPHAFFTYQENGNIVPLMSLPEKDKERARSTIEAFNLNHELLRRKRLDMMRVVEEYRGGGLNFEDTREALKDYGFPSVLDYMEKMV